ncbi:MAG: penicillin-binding protein 2 [Clostridiales bacterium]|nr:penicillin-binding protein 2 [Clostridiales bacterium]
MNESSSFFQKRIRKRTIILSFFFFLWFSALTLRLVELQVIEHGRLRAAAFRQNQLKSKIIPERGTIYDRRGIILARSFPAPSVSYIPSEEEPLPQKLAKIEELSRVLELSNADLTRIKARIEKGETFVWIKRKISPEKAEQVKRLGMSEITIQEENKRYYPLGRLAAHVLGGVNIDDEGAGGVELECDVRLKGVAGEGLFLRDAKKRHYHREVLKPPTPGEDLILTVDETIQYIAQRELERAVESHQANWGTVIISHPPSGEILAMASSPGYDPNDFSRAHPEERRNRAIQYNFEPGSTFKIVTAAAAREFGLVDFMDTFDCSNGSIRVAGWTISDHKKMGVLSLSEVLIHSSNVGTAMVGQRIGPEILYRTIKAFRFGEKTGVELPGEEAGIFHPLPKWSGSSLASQSIGYGISVTAIQVLQAMNVFANNGLLIPLRVTRETFDFSPSLQAARPAGERIISEKTASDLVEKVFEKVVLDGTGQAARLKGFTVAGKTGTAQKIDPVTGAYSARKHLASFVGFAPARKPFLSMIVVIDEPKAGLHYGGQVAAPVFQEIARRVLLYLGQTPQFDPAKKVITAQLREASYR